MKRSKGITFMVTEDEKNSMELEANKMGFTLSMYIRQLHLAHSRKSNICPYYIEDGSCMAESCIHQSDIGNCTVGGYQKIIK